MVKILDLAPLASVSAAPFILPSPRAVFHLKLNQILKSLIRLETQIKELLVNPFSPNLQARLIEIWKKARSESHSYDALTDECRQTFPMGPQFLAAVRKIDRISKFEALICGAPRFASRGRFYAKNGFDFITGGWLRYIRCSPCQMTYNLDEIRFMSAPSFDWMRQNSRIIL